MLAVELGQQHIRVNAICPGSIKTEINDNTENRASESLAPKAEFPEGEIPLTGKRPGTALSAISYQALERSTACKPFRSP
jgi:NAD(P)-dependent dehydrogenase (short-subunit alcohol dehydrogenase family)